MKIKFLHIVTRIDIGGISTFLLNYFKHMNKNHISFDVVAIDTRIKQGYHQIFQDLGMNVYYMPNSIRNRTIYLLNLIKKNNYDVVHSHIELQSSYYLSLAALAGVKNRISHAHLSKDNPGFKNQLMRQVLNRIATYKAGASDLFKSGFWKC